MAFGPHEVAADIRPIYAKRWNKILPTADTNWVIKLILPESSSMDNLEEIQHVLRIAAMPPRFCVEFPIKHHYLFGTNAEGVWYALARYDGHVDTSEYCRTNWKLIGSAVLCFLEDLHHQHRVIHMDIKAENILVDYAARRFVVADFELLTAPQSSLLRDEIDLDFLWYYIGHGADLDHPVKTWRTDLIMLGHLLARLTWNYDYTWTARERCWQKSLRPTSQAEIRELILHRDSQLRAGAAPAVVAYLTHVAEHVSWDPAVPPPPAELYTSLREILRN
jgi:serine/threonine protein kinase